MRKKVIETLKKNVKTHWSYQEKSEYTINSSERRNQNNSRDTKCKEGMTENFQQSLLTQIPQFITSFEHNNFKF
jgi:hypothetical protein